jgi:hypothetical protein
MLTIKARRQEMIDPRICGNPITLIRYKNKNGEYLYSREECLRLLEIYLDRAKKVWKEEARAAPAHKRGPAPPAWKGTGRGRLFWIDSE